ncbi:hypothetical protein C8J56DRAFT_939412, partial [Mycena floridula]
MNFLLRLLHLKKKPRSLQTQIEPYQVKLPPELELEIFSIALRDWKSIQLLQVAKYVHRGLEEDLYASIRVVKLACAHKYDPTILMNDGPLPLTGSFYPHIRTLILRTPDLRVSTLLHVFRQATGLESIISHVQYGFCEESFQTIPAPANFKRLWGPAIRNPIEAPFFTNLTHLTLRSFIDKAGWDAVQSLSFLTHFACDITPLSESESGLSSPSQIQALLLIRPNIQLIWLMVREAEHITWSTATFKELADPRVVALGSVTLKMNLLNPYSVETLETWKMAEGALEEQLKTGTRGNATHSAFWRLNVVCIALARYI